MSALSRVDDIFFAALEKGSADERAAYLAEACQDDPELRLKVERLLNAHANADRFLEHPPIELQVTSDSPSAERSPKDPGDAPPNLAGSHVGPYRLLEQIGEGGMGVVYMADQQTPIRRRVALKVIKPGLDTHQVIARFEAERQALALMDHPNIARVLNAGTTDMGRPYFVMELVRGVPITDYCDQNNLPVHERLDLFAQVCHAVQHAHQKGIIHRDIKPSNVLVTMNDGRAVPKVIDFGVAKATNQQLTDRTLFTNFAQMIGTPLYMSPEQAEMTSLDVDTRTDIYSLGVLLYELLTGTTPFDRVRLREAAYDEIRRIIREEVPQRPSLRISTLGESRTAVAARRRADPSRLGQLVQGDLDWIVMKALEKDRTRRYETATGLAADIARYLSDQPVEAGPPSAVYRFRKFARRNRVAIGTAMILVSALVLGTAISTWQAIRATQAERRADEQADEARASALLATNEKQRADDNASEAESRAQEAIMERERAVGAFEQARHAVDESFTTISDNQLLDVPGLQPLRKELLQNALKYYERFLLDRADDPRVRVGLAGAHLRVGKIRATLGEVAEAEDSFRQAIEILENLSQEYPAVSAGKDLLAISHQKLANLQSKTGRPAEAELSYQKAIDILELVVQEAPAVPEYQSNLANSYQDLGVGQNNTGRKAEAAVSYQKAIDLREKLAQKFPAVSKYHSKLAGSYSVLANLQSATGHKSDAEALYQKAIGIGEELTQHDPGDAEYQSDLAKSYFALATVQSALGHHPESEALHQKAVDIRERLTRINPAASKYQSDLAESYTALAYQYRMAGRQAEAESLCKQAIEMHAKLARENPVVPGYQRDLAGSYTDLAWFAYRDGRKSDAAAAYQKAITILETLAPENPAVPEYQSELARNFNLLAVTEMEAGRKSESETAFQKTIAILEKLTRENPTVVEHLRELGGNYVNLAHVQRGSDRKSEALTQYRKAGRIFVQLRAADPTDKTVSKYADRAHIGVLLLWVFGGLGEHEEIERIITAAGENKPNEVSSSVAMGAALFRLGRHDEAQKVLKQAIGVVDFAIRFQPDVDAESARCEVAFGQLVLAMNEHRLGKPKDGHATLQRAVRTVDDIRNQIGEGGRIPMLRSKGVDVEALLNEANSLINDAKPSADPGSIKEPHAESIE